LQLDKGGERVEIFNLPQLNKTLNKYGFAVPLLVGLLIFSYSMFVPATSTGKVLLPVTKISPALFDHISASGLESVNVIIETYTSDYESIVSQIVNMGGEVTYQYKYVTGLAAKIPADKVVTVASDPNVKQIYLDQPRYPSAFIWSGNELDPVIANEEEIEFSAEGALKITLTEEQIEPVLTLVETQTYWNPVAMNALGVWATGDFGQSSLAVVIDTGIYADHFMISGSVIGGIDMSTDVGTEYEGWSRPDNHWHGTHVAGILAGHGAILVHSSDPLYQAIARYGAPPPEASSIGYPGYHIIPLLGMAPQAQLYAVKVFPHTGAGASESRIIAAIEYSISLKLEMGYDVDIISMSLGGPTLFDGRDLEDQTVDYATSVGITVVAAAGNDGPALMTIGSPGTAETAITVAAAAHPVNTRVFWDYYYGKPGIGYQLFVSDIPQIHAFSSRGPTSDGRGKPDIAATGVFVLSAFPTASSPQGLAFASGTSMATPAVSGAVALLDTYAEATGMGASPEDYKQALKTGAVWLDGYNNYDQGAGYLNAYNALIALLEDPSLGDVAPPLPSEYELLDISNIQVDGKYRDEIKNLLPGYKKDYIFKVTPETSLIEFEIERMHPKKRDPYDGNSFEIYIHTAKRTYYSYWIESANVWKEGEFKITDDGYSYEGTVSGVYSDWEVYRYTIEPGYVKITVENDWTSSGPLSCKIEINVKTTPLTPDFSDSGVIQQDEMLVYGLYELPAGTTSVTVELTWENNWAKYPSSDLDLLIWWYDGAEFHFAGYAAATLNIPERITISEPTMVGIWIQIYGYAIYTSPGPNGEPGGTESWTLSITHQ
jgi:subtilisin family serine protease